VQEAGHPTTCGELRARFYRGEALLDTGANGVGALFTGNDTTTLESGFGTSTLTAAQYNSLWLTWGGFLLRPDNFDDLVAERYGSAFGPGRNPYPKPGEDPNRTNGGSGRLPEMFTQLRLPDGRWSGRIGITCHACHSGAVNGTLAPGGGSSLQDLHLLLRDAAPLGYLPSLAALANLTRTRGTNNASDINLAFIFPDQGVLPLDVFFGVLGSGSTASMDTPAWWNMGHRPVKFVDGVFPIDAPRVDMVFYTPFFGLFGSLGGPISEAGQDWMRAHGPDLNSWVETLKAPRYPGTVNTALAEQGAVLFHTLDLWAPTRNNPVARPSTGNGSSEADALEPVPVDVSRLRSERRSDHGVVQPGPDGALQQRDPRLERALPADHHEHGHRESQDLQRLHVRSGQWRARVHVGAHGLRATRADRVHEDALGAPRSERLDAPA
jgi:hypothetical protein